MTGGSVSVFRNAFNRGGCRSAVAAASVRFGFGDGPVTGAEAPAEDRAAAPEFSPGGAEARADRRARNAGPESGAGAGRRQRGPRRSAGAFAGRANAGRRSSDDGPARPRATPAGALATARRAGTAALLLACLALPLAALFSTPAHAQTEKTRVTNHSGANATSNGTVGGPSGSQWGQAQQFTTGAGSHTLGSVVAHLRSVGSQAAVKVSIYTSTSGNKPDTSLYVLNNPTTIAATSDNTFTAPNNATLAANTKYFVVFENTAMGSGSSYTYSVRRTTWNSATANTGWSIADTSRSRTSETDNWTSTINDSIKIAVKTSHNAATGQPAISGTAQVGNTLTANKGTIADSDGLPSFPGGFTFQWVRGGTNISGATSREYTLTDDDQGNTLKVRVSFTDNEGFSEGPLESVATSSVAAMPANGCTPDDLRLVGGDNDREGEVEICHNNQWRNVCDDDWEKVDANVACKQLGYTQGARRATILSEFTTLISVQFWLDDVACTGSETKLAECEHAGWGVNNCTHAERAGVVCKANANVAATGQPAISGTAVTGEDLTASTDGISDDNGNTKAEDGDTGFAYTYQWFRVDSDGTSNKTQITGETASTYTLVAADVGKKVIVEVSFTDDESNAEGPLASDAYPAGTGTVESADSTPPEVDSATVDGTSLAITFNEDLAAAANLANDAFEVKRTPPGEAEETVTLTGSPAISGMTVTLTLDAAVIAGDAVTVGYTKPTSGTDNVLEDAAGNEVADFTETVTNDTEVVNNPATGVAIDGPAQVGMTLTADTSGIEDADGLTGATFEYQWFSGGTEIPGETGSTYTVRPADVLKRIKLRVTFKDDAGNDEAPESPAIAPAVPAAADHCDSLTVWCATLTAGADDAILDDAGRLLDADETGYLRATRSGRGRAPAVPRRIRRRLLADVIEPFEEQKAERGESDWNDVAIEAAATHSHGYDVVVVDEAQDLSANQVRTILAHLREDHSTTFIMDAVQRIYPQGFQWREVGIDMRPQMVFALTRNHRNTGEIARFAASLVRDLPLEEDGLVPDANACERSGPLPRVVVGRYAAQVNYMLNEVQEAIESEETIAILHPKGWFDYARGTLDRRGIDYCELTRQREWPTGPELVALSTFHSAKGLEFDHVLMPGLNQEVTPHGDEDGDGTLDSLRRLVAMGIGRARRSVMVGCKPGEESTLIEMFDPETYELVRV